MGLCHVGFKHKLAFLFAFQMPSFYNYVSYFVPGTLMLLLCANKTPFHF